jgi:hypothetical protein
LYKYQLQSIKRIVVQWKNWWKKNTKPPLNDIESGIGDIIHSSKAWNKEKVVGRPTNTEQ